MVKMVNGIWYVFYHTHTKGWVETRILHRVFWAKGIVQSKAPRAEKTEEVIFLTETVKSQKDSQVPYGKVWQHKLMECWSKSGRGREAVECGVSVSSEVGQIMLSPGPRGLGGGWGVRRFKEVWFSVLGNRVASPRQKSRGLGRIQLKSGPRGAEHEVIISVGETHRAGRRETKSRTSPHTRLWANLGELAHSGLPGSQHRRTWGVCQGSAQEPGKSDQTSGHWALGSRSQFRTSSEAGLGLLNPSSEDSHGTWGELKKNEAEEWCGADRLSRSIKGKHERKDCWEGWGQTGDKFNAGLHIWFELNPMSNRRTENSWIGKS